MIHNLGTQYTGSPGLHGAQVVGHCGSSPFSRPAMCDTHVAVGGCGSYGIVHDTKGRRLIGWSVDRLEDALTGGRGNRHPRTIRLLGVGY